MVATQLLGRLGYAQLIGHMKSFLEPLDTIDHRCHRIANIVQDLGGRVGLASLERLKQQGLASLVDFTRQIIELRCQCTNLIVSLQANLMRQVSAFANLFHVAGQRLDRLQDRVP